MNYRSSLPRLASWMLPLVLFGCAGGRVEREPSPEVALVQGARSTAIPAALSGVVEIRAVDGDRVREGSGVEFQKPVELRAGQHDLAVGVKMLSGGWSSLIRKPVPMMDTLRLRVRAGCRYVIYFERESGRFRVSESFGSGYVWGWDAPSDAVRCVMVEPGLSRCSFEKPASIAAVASRNEAAARGKDVDASGRDARETGADEPSSVPLPTSYATPRVQGRLFSGEAPAVGIDLTICLVAADGSCTGESTPVRTNAQGDFEFARGSWGEIAPYKMLGPDWCLWAVQEGRRTTLFKGPLIGDPANLWMAVSCNLRRGSKDFCHVSWATGR